MNAHNTSSEENILDALHEAVKQNTTEALALAVAILDDAKKSPAKRAFFNEPLLALASYWGQQPGKRKDASTLFVKLAMGAPKGSLDEASAMRGLTSLVAPNHDTQTTALIFGAAAQEITRNKKQYLLETLERSFSKHMRKFLEPEDRADFCLAAIKQTETGMKRYSSSKTYPSSFTHFAIESLLTLGEQARQNRPEWQLPLETFSTVHDFVLQSARPARKESDIVARAVSCALSLPEEKRAEALNLLWKAGEAAPPDSVLSTVLSLAEKSKQPATKQAFLSFVAPFVNGANETRAVALFDDVIAQPDEKIAAFCFSLSSKVKNKNSLKGKIVSTLPGMVHFFISGERVDKWMEAFAQTTYTDQGAVKRAALGDALSMINPESGRRLCLRLAPYTLRESEERRAVQKHLADNLHLCLEDNAKPQKRLGPCLETFEFLEKQTEPYEKVKEKTISLFKEIKDDETRAATFKSLWDRAPALSEPYTGKGNTIRLALLDMAQPVGALFAKAQKPYRAYLDILSTCRAEMQEDPAYEKHPDVISTGSMISGFYVPSGAAKKRFIEALTF